MRLTDPSDSTTPLTLYRTATDALTAASRQRGRQLPGSDPYRSLGSLRQLLVALDASLDGVGTTLLEQARSGELIVVEGPFAEDALAAAATARQWLDRARTGLHLGVRQPLESAHITIAGTARN
ncbi:hypothetical protein [Amycolatopsis antarctica]|nr:hypothetical protein [Amycolatopsis antarctica]